MESKEDHDIFSIAANTIMRWYEQTHTTMTVARKLPSPLNSEFMGILLAAKKQTEGALTTLANKSILSTHALLRILVETFVVLAWALRVPESEENTKSDEVYKRLRRWDLTRLSKDKALLENLPRTTEIESAIGKVTSDIAKLRSQGIKKLPNAEQLFRDLGGKEPDKVKECTEAYAKSYRLYSRAVHLNRNVTQKLAWIQYENGEPKKVLYKDDIGPDGYELLMIASISCDINRAIRGFYDWHSDAMENEYKQLRPGLIKK